MTCRLTTMQSFTMKIRPDNVAHSTRILTHIPNTNDVIKNFRWLYLFSNICFMNCYNMPRDRNGSVSFGIRHGLKTVIGVCWIVAINIFNIRFNVKYGISQSLIITRATTTLLMLITIHVSLHIILDAYHRKSIWQIILNLYDFDHDVSSHIHRISYSYSGHILHF